MAVINTEDEYKKLIQGAQAAKGNVPSSGVVQNLPLSTGTATATPLGTSTGTPTATPLSSPAATSYATTPNAKAPTSGYAATTIPTATSHSDYLRSLYDAQREASVAALQGAYQQNIAALDATAAKIPEQYTAARNQTAASAEQGRRNFNEYAAASGLNTGTGGQAQLAINTTLQGNLNTINQAEADALADIETQRLQIQAEYQTAIAQAIAESNIAKAQALYEEAIRVDDGMVTAALNQADENYRAWSANQAVSEQERAALESQAKNLANYGDFSGYSQLGYTADQIAQMQSVWAAANPTLAAALGISGYGSYGGYSGYSGGGGSGSGYTVTLSDDAEQIYQAAQRAYSSGKNDKSIQLYVEQRVDNGKITPEESSAILGLMGIEV